MKIKLPYRIRLAGFSLCAAFCPHIMAQPFFADHFWLILEYE
jgi:hypothetical protein